jgi:hypothetical protein
MKAKETIIIQLPTGYYVQSFQRRNILLTDIASKAKVYTRLQAEKMVTKYCKTGKLVQFPKITLL